MRLLERLGFFAEPARHEIEPDETMMRRPA
jgi:hypothetical protein